MCGIVGYIGAKDSVPIIIESLGHLEYRGYDSAGIAVIDAAGTLTGSKAGIGATGRVILSLRGCA